jgi:5-methylcytosine-specific restriction endonuclease McrA
MPMDRSLYPKDWDDIARLVKELVEWRCERCGQEHDARAAQTILTVHHKDGDPQNNGLDNLEALCAPCHLRTQAHNRKYGSDRGPKLPLT